MKDLNVENPLGTKGVGVPGMPRGAKGQGSRNKSVEIHVLFVCAGKTYEISYVYFHWVGLREGTYT